MLTDSQMDQIKEWLVEAGNFALEQRDSIGYELKMDRTPVTAVEYQIEKRLAERLAKLFPGDQIITEENGVLNAHSDRVWALDPIDGTRAYVGGLPTWGVSLGLLVKGQPAAGFFYMPVLNEMYWSCERGAFLNKQRLSGGLRPTLDDPLAFLAVPSNAFLNFEIQFPRVRSLGSTAYHLALVGRGAACGAIVRHNHIWDIAGLLPLLEKTGILVETLAGGRVDFGLLLDGHPMAEPLLAASQQWMEPLRAAIRRK